MNKRPSGANLSCLGATTLSTPMLPTPPPYSCSFLQAVHQLKDMCNQLCGDPLAPETHEAVLSKLRALIESLIPLHQVALDCRAKSVGEPLTPLAMRKPNIQLDTSRALGQRISCEEKKSPNSQLHAFRKTWDESPLTPSWSLVPSTRKKKGGDEHLALEKKAEDNRNVIDSLHERVYEINQDIKSWEDEVADKMQQLNPFGDNGEESENSRDDLQIVVKKLESAEFKLASLREEELLHTEANRGIKLSVWKLALDDRVDSMVQEMEVALRAGHFAGVRKHKQLEALLQELHAESKALDIQSIDITQKVYSLAAEVQAHEQQLATMQDDDPWTCPGVSDSSADRIMSVVLSKRWEVEVLALKRAYLRNRQLKIVKNLGNILRVKQALSRYFTIDKMIRAGDRAGLSDKACVLKVLYDQIALHTSDTKQAIEKTILSQMATRSELRKLKFVQNTEADDIRDNLLLLTHELTLRRTDLAWLRKDELQIIELLRMMRTRPLPRDFVEPGSLDRAH